MFVAKAAIFVKITPPLHKNNENTESIKLIVSKTIQRYKQITKIEIPSEKEPENITAQSRQHSVQSSGDRCRGTENNAVAVFEKGDYTEGSTQALQDISLRNLLM